MSVFVINQRNQPLMPCTPRIGICVPIQNLVKLGHAKELKLDE